METETGYPTYVSEEYMKEYKKAINEVTKPCAGGHKVDGQVPKLHQIELGGKTCDCGRIRYVVEGCGCGGNSKELHSMPNQL